ncbi:MAG: hypothetical protein AAFX09_13210 [Pseudomonadota bacterium]
MLTSRAEFALKDAAALSALLGYDWRQRELLTDLEMVGEAGRAGVLTGAQSASVLRHMQRLRWIAALHGVRPHGGRMRLWSLTDALRAQLALDLRDAAQIRLVQAIEALLQAGDPVRQALADWRAAAPLDTSGQARLDALTTEQLLGDDEALGLFARASIHRFVDRCGVHEAVAPAFLRTA